MFGQVSRARLINKVDVLWSFALVYRLREIDVMTSRHELRRLYSFQLNQTRLSFLEKKEHLQKILPSY